MIKPTKADFDRAVAQPWSGTTCLVAQLMIRKGIIPNTENCKHNPHFVAVVNKIRDLMTEFDNAYAREFVDKVRLQRLRASLPYFNWPWQRLKLSA